MSNTSPTKQPPPKSSGKNVTCNVFFLDGENVEFSIDVSYSIARSVFQIQILLECLTTGAGINSVIFV